LLCRAYGPKGYSRESFVGKKANRLDERRLAILKEFIREWYEDTGYAWCWTGVYRRRKDRLGRRARLEGAGKPDPVGPDALFIAASNTKALTTLLLAELVDEGKMCWDQP
jgi:CubicO group peptidase (beta-lactamase class C family)